MAEGGGDIVKQVLMAGEGKRSIRRLIVGDFVGTLNGLFIEWYRYHFS